MENIPNFVWYPIAAIIWMGAFAIFCWIYTAAANGVKDGKKKREQQRADNQK
ncbi:MAG: hypothetical protein WCH86_02270 [Kiritimatiellales bacterium]